MTSTQTLTTYSLDQTYTCWMIQDSLDRKRISFHVENEEFFDVLRESLSFVQEKLDTIYKEGRSWYATSKERELLEQIQKDLLYVKDHYDLKPKPKINFWDRYLG